MARRASSRCPSDVPIIDKVGTSGGACVLCRKPTVMTQRTWTVGLTIVMSYGQRCGFCGWASLPPDDLGR